VTEVIRRVAATPDVDRSRVSLVGYSNGGKLAYWLGCEHPGLVSVLGRESTPSP